MDMRIDQARCGVRAPGVKFLLSAVIVSETDNATVCDGDGIVTYRTGIDIDDMAVIDDQIGRNAVHRRVDHAAQCPFIHMLHSESSFSCNYSAPPGIAHDPVR